MDDDSPPEKRTAPLLSVEELKKLCLEQFKKYKIQELRLKGGTESLKDFVDLCFLENGKYDRYLIVWITDNAFVRLGLHCDLPTPYRDRRFSLKLWATDDNINPDHELSIHSSTTEEAIAALDFLAGLQDSYFKKMELRYCVGRSGQRPICPLSRGCHLEIFVRNANRENTFSFMAFTRDQCQTLATSGIRTNIGFRSCRFEDEGIAFVEASAARENQESGPAKLSIWDILPFDEGHFRLFLSQHRLESLILLWIRLRHEESCSYLAAADLTYLELRSCELADGGAAHVESVREGRGPRGLSIGRNQFDSTERFLTFINALRGNAYLERLDVHNMCSGDGSPQALASALLENKGLVHFGLHRCRLDDHCWSKLMAAISMHPTLRTLKFRDVSSSSSTNRDRTKQIANMLLVNKHIDEIPFSVSFDRDDWNALVAPCLECNLYRKRFDVIPKIQEPSTRAAIVARALARVEKKPSLVWMVLSQNHDVVCSYQGEALREDSVSIPSRKRRRSPSDDDVGAHRIQSK
jgi:hypothetical protein